MKVSGFKSFRFTFVVKRLRLARCTKNLQNLQFLTEPDNVSRDAR